MSLLLLAATGSRRSDIATLTVRYVTIPLRRGLLLGLSPKHRKQHMLGNRLDGFRVAPKVMHHPAAREPHQADENTRGKNERYAY